MTALLEHISFGWLKRGATYLFKLGKRMATLEERVTALEEALKREPGDACPYCGARAMRKITQGRLMGEPGRQWRTDIWHCEGCGRTDERTQRV
jgi:hypothetical protein